MVEIAKQATTSLSTALAEAKRRNRLVWVSLGAPWNEAATSARTRALSVKAVQELRERFVTCEIDAAVVPELDHAAQFLLQRFAGNSGWPAEFFLTPNGQALLGTTALEPDDLRKLLFEMLSAWDIDAKAISAQAQESWNAARALDPLKREDLLQNAPLANMDAEAMAMSLLTPLEQSLDFETGFVGQGDVFQAPSVYKCLLASENLAKWAELALTQLAKSHLCDTLEGGFYRAAARSPEAAVSTEKLLAENAELLDAYVSFRHPKHAEFLVQTASEIVRAISQDFKIPSGVGFASTLSGSAAYYRLSPADLLKALPGPQRQPAQMFFGVESGGQVPYLPTELPLLSSFLTIAPVDLSHLLTDAKKRLAEFRRRREVAKPTRGVRARYPEALAVRALFRASVLADVVTSAMIQNTLLPILEDWNQSKSELTVREKWATWSAQVAAAKWSLAAGDRALAMKILDHSDEFLSAHRRLDSIEVETSMVGLRWDLADHLGPSAGALRLRGLLDRWECAEMEGDLKRVRESADQLKQDFAALRPLCRPLGLYAAGVYEAFLRFEDKYKHLN